MHIFRLPAPLNAFRGNVLDVSPRFRTLPFSTLVRHRCAVPPCSPLPVPPRLPLSVSRLVRRLVSSCSRSARSPRFSPRLTSFRLPCRPIVSRSSVAIFAPSVVSWSEESSGAVRRNPLRQSSPCRYPSHSLGVSSSPRQSCRETGRQAGRASFAHAVCAFVRFPCSKGNLYIFLWKIA